MDGRARVFVGSLTSIVFLIAASLFVAKGKVWFGAALAGLALFRARRVVTDFRRLKGE